MNRRPNLYTPEPSTQRAGHAMDRSPLLVALGSLRGAIAALVVLYLLRMVVPGLDIAFSVAVMWVMVAAVVWAVRAVWRSTVGGGASDR